MSHFSFEHNEASCYQSFVRKAVQRVAKKTTYNLPYGFVYGCRCFENASSHVTLGCITIGPSKPDFVNGVDNDWADLTMVSLFPPKAHGKERREAKKEADVSPCRRLTTR